MDPTPFEEVWRRVFPRLDELYRGIRSDGLLVASVWQGRLLDAHLHVPIDLDTEFISVGRHTQCDLCLDRDDSVSLRHLIVSASRRGSDVRVRLLDLQSGFGMVTEDGQFCEGIAADGAVFVRVGSYQLLLLPTGALAPIPWGGSAEEVWQGIPERVYVDQRIPTGSETPPVPEPGPKLLNILSNFLLRKRNGPPLERLKRRNILGSFLPRKQETPPPEPAPDLGLTRGRSTINRLLDPPTPLRRQRPPPGSRGDRIGVLELVAGRASESYPLREADVDRGVLIGRYDRCEFRAKDVDLSRVHLLIVRDGRDIWAVDTASSYGTTAEHAPIRQLRLGDGAELVLAERVRLRWSLESSDDAVTSRLLRSRQR